MKKTLRARIRSKRTHKVIRKTRKTKKTRRVAKRGGGLLNFLKKKNPVNSTVANTCKKKYIRNLLNIAYENLISKPSSNYYINNFLTKLVIYIKDFNTGNCSEYSDDILNNIPDNINNTYNNIQNEHYRKYEEMSEKTKLPINHLIILQLKNAYDLSQEEVHFLKSIMLDENKNTHSSNPFSLFSYAH